MAEGTLLISGAASFSLWWLRYALLFDELLKVVHFERVVFSDLPASQPAQQTSPWNAAMFCQNPSRTVFKNRLNQRAWITKAFEQYRQVGSKRSHEPRSWNDFERLAARSRTELSFRVCRVQSLGVEGALLFGPLVPELSQAQIVLCVKLLLSRSLLILEKKGSR